MKMENINRNNYEGFFLLYVDNELSAAEKKAVGKFVEENADLKNEFLQLQQAVLPADEIIFTGKIDLYKPEAQGDLLQEKLLLHLDGELDNEAAAEMNKHIAADDKLKADWQILQQTKLYAAEKIIFPDKHLLYRKERDNVVVIKFVKWAIAAAIIGAGFFVGITLLNKKAPENNTAKINDVNKNNAITVKPVAQTPKNNTGTQQQTTTAQNNVGINITTQTPSARKEKEVRNNIAANQQKPNRPAPEKNNAPGEKPLLANNIAQKPIENTGDENKSSSLATVSPKIELVPANTLTDTNLLLADNSLAKNTGLDNTAAENNANRILYMNEETVTRSKAAGFFRKLKRVVQRNTNIKTEKGLHIGGFELAIK